MEANISVGATVGADVAAAVGDAVGESGVAAPDPWDPVAAGGAVGAGAVVGGVGGSVAGGAGVAGTDVGTWVAAESPPPQAARNKESAIAAMTMSVVDSGNPKRRRVQSMEPPAAWSG